MARRGYPTVETLAIIVAVYVLQSVAGAIASATGLFVLSADVANRPWTLVTSVYAHANATHLVTNAVALALVGPLVSRRTTRLRFHAFFLGTGATAALAQVFVGGLVGTTAGVLGASGAIFALLGYLLSGNVVSSRLLDALAPTRFAQVVLFLAVAIGITLATGTARAALIAHAVGLLLGLFAGVANLLDV